MPQTRAAFVNQCLYNLGVIALGQPISNDLIVKMDGIVDPAFALLAARGIYYVQDPGEPNPPSDGNIDDAAFLPLADWVANKATSAFNFPSDAKLMALSLRAEEDLKIISAPPRTLKTLQVDPATRARRLSNYRGTI